jgi:hypothetical protein
VPRAAAGAFDDLLAPLETASGAINKASTQPAPPSVWKSGAPFLTVAALACSSSLVAHGRRILRRRDVLDDAVHCQKQAGGSDLHGLFMATKSLGVLNASASTSSKGRGSAQSGASVPYARSWPMP